MNANDWLIVCKMVEARWGPSKRWDRAGDLALDKQVVALERQWAEQAIDQIKTEYAPAPIAVIRAGFDVQAAARRLAAGLGSCRHSNWAFLDMDTKEDGRRHGTCVACGAERWFAPGKLQTATEQGTDQFADLVPPEVTVWPERNQPGRV